MFVSNDDYKSNNKMAIIIIYDALYLKPHNKDFFRGWIPSAAYSMPYAACTPWLKLACIVSKGKCHYFSCVKEKRLEWLCVHGCIQIHTHKLNYPFPVWSVVLLCDQWIKKGRGFTRWHHKKHRGFPQIKHHQRNQEEIRSIWYTTAIGYCCWCDNWKHVISIL